VGDGQFNPAFVANKTLTDAENLFSGRQVGGQQSPGIPVYVPGELRAQGEKTMNKDQVTGKVEKIAGRVKEEVGETLGNQKLANQGVADQVKGAAKETWGNVKDAAGATADRHRREAELKADDARAGVREKVDEVQQNVNDRIDAHKAEERNKARTA
jgi:uncharacterized protein YjbJ (UPF0337 family)